MTTASQEISPRVLARIAGAAYLIIIMAGIFAEVFVRSNLIEPGDASATAANVLASEGLFRTGFFADSIMLLSDVAVAVLFYLLLRPVSQVLALLAAAFRLTQAAVLGLNLLNYHTALLILTDSGYRTAFNTDQLNVLALQSLEAHAYGYDLGLLFFALSTLVMGYLVALSGYFPRILGIGLAAAGLVYLIGSYVRFLAPDVASYIEPAYVVPLVAELSFCLYLLIRGVRVQERPRPLPVRQ